MYKKNSNGWLKHIDFILLDLLCVQIAFILAYFLRHKLSNPYVVPVYRNMAIFIEFADIAIIFLFETYKNVLKRGYFVEFTYSVKQAVMLLLIASLYLITEQDGEEYSRIVLYLMSFIFGILIYVVSI